LGEFFWELVLSFGSLPFPSVILPSRTPKGYYTNRWASIQRCKNMSDKKNPPYEFTCNDPVIQTILERWRFPVWFIPMTMILTDIAIYFGLGSSLGYLHTNTNIKGTLDAPGELVISFIVQPIIVAYFLWFPSRVQKVFNDLSNNEVIPKNVQKSKFTDFLKYFTQLYNHRLGIWFSVLFSIIMVVWLTIWAVQLKLGGFWVHYLIWPFVIFEIPKMFLTAYAL